MAIIDGTAADDSLTGGAGTDTISGMEGNDTLDGGADADVMIGGTGDDTYVVDNTGDIIVENPAEGTDTVISSVSYTLAANVDNMTLTGSDNINASGNADNNVLIGNAGNNVINGHGGADTMTGNAGDDTFFVDNTGDVVVENASEGHDLVVSTKSYVLADNVEDLTLSGAAIKATGNALDNVLTGDASNNTITGNEGNDTLQGGVGDDILKGGAGNDTYVFAQGDGNDTITDTDGTDTIKFDASVAASDVTYTQAGIDLVIHDGATSDSITVTGFFSGALSQVESVSFSDGTVHDVAFIQAHIGATQGGNGGDDVLVGQPGTTLDGGAGNDFLINTSGNNVFIGGTGDDTMIAGAGNDTFLFARGDGHDYVLDTGGTDQIVFDASVAASSVTYTRDGHDLVISDGTGGDTIDVARFFTGAANQVESVVFSDGTIHDAAYIQNHLSGNQGGNSGGGGQGRNHDDNLVGTDGNDLLSGGNGNDSVSGGLGDDRLLGGNGNDNIVGGDGNDTLSGGNGTDTLNGGLGQDTLAGGNGPDTFVFDTAPDASNVDTLTDFKANLDVLDIHGILNGFNGNASEFVQLTQSGRDTILSVDADGALNGSVFTEVAVLHNAARLDLDTLVNSGHLIVA